MTSIISITSPILDNPIPVTTTSSSSSSSSSLPSTLLSSSPSSSTSESAIVSTAHSVSSSLGFVNPESVSTILSTSINSTSTHRSVSTTTYRESVTSASGASDTLAAVSATSVPQSKDSPAWLTTPLFGGLIAGSFVLGALIAGLFIFALLKKRSRRSEHVSPSKYIPVQDHADAGEKVSATSTVTTLAEPNFLPQQIEDAEVKRRVLSLTDQIDQHVENFYRNSKIHMNETVESQISSFETMQMPNPLASCFETATYPLVLVRHCLAFHVFSQTVAPGEDTELILPAEIAGMVSEMYHKCLSPTTSQDTIAAFSLWKGLTGYLRPSLANGTAPMHATSDAANRFARQFSRSFTPWCNPQYTEDHRIDHLAALVDHAIDTGVWLFSQPDSYRFNWNTLSHSGRNSTTKQMMRETVVVPGIFKMTHAGVLLNGQGQSVVQPVVRPF